MSIVTDDQVILISKLRKEGLTRQQIAAELGISLARVKRAISKHSLTAVKELEQKERKRSIPMSPEEGIGLMDRCKIVLGRRMGEDFRGYLLDGRPASSKQVARAAGLGG